MSLCTLGNNDSGSLCIPSWSYLKVWWLKHFLFISLIFVLFLYTQWWQSTPNLKLRPRWENLPESGDFCSFVPKIWTHHTFTFLCNLDEVFKPQLVMPRSDFRGPRSLALRSLQSTRDQQAGQVHYYSSNRLYYWVQTWWYVSANLNLSCHVSVMESHVCAVTP